MEKLSEIQSFATRLNEVCDDMGIPPKGKGRQNALAQKFGVSQKGARKWVEAETYPTLDKIAQIVRWAGVSHEWLMTGRGNKHLPALQEAHPVYLNEREKALIDNFRHAEEEGARAIERMALIEASQAQHKEAADAPASELLKSA